jgi:hypothetical protein
VLLTLCLKTGVPASVTRHKLAQTCYLRSLKKNRELSRRKKLLRRRQMRRPRLLPRESSRRRLKERRGKGRSKRGSNERL